MKRTTLRRVVIPIAVFVLLMLGCSAADLVQREREEAMPTEAPTQAELLPTFTATPVPAQQTVVIVTPPSTDQPGVIIVPPGMDPSSVVPILPSSTPTPSLTPTETPTVIVVVPPESNPVSLLPTP